MDQHLEQTLGHQLVEEMANQPSKTHQVHYISLSGLHRDELNKATMIVRGEQRKVWDYIIGKPATNPHVDRILQPIAGARIDIAPACRRHVLMPSEQII